MDPIILTPRLKLTLITHAKKDSTEFGWLHELYSNEQSTWWSLHGRAKSTEETEKLIEGLLPSTEEGERTWRVAYAVHKVLEPSSHSIRFDEPGGKATEFLGLITLKSLTAYSLALPSQLSLASATSPTTLTLELAYMYLPGSWGRGYATESVRAVLDSCKRAPPFALEPFDAVYVRAIVNGRNLPSARIMRKVGMRELGVYEWRGRVFLSGEWRTEDSLLIFGRLLGEE